MRVPFVDAEHGPSLLQENTRTVGRDDDLPMQFEDTMLDGDEGLCRRVLDSEWTTGRQALTAQKDRHKNSLSRFHVDSLSDLPLAMTVSLLLVTCGNSVVNSF